MERPELIAGPISWMKSSAMTRSQNASSIVERSMRSLAIRWPSTRSQ
jgi:hypothetical protein